MVLGEKTRRVETTTARHDTRHHHRQREHTGNWMAFHRTSPGTERRFTGPRREQALTQTHHFFTFASFHRRASKREVETSSRNEAITQTIKNPSLTIHAPSPLNFRSSESINRTIRELIRHIKHVINRITTRETIETKPKPPSKRKDHTMRENKPARKM
ncbi:hypothetical protein Bca4012_093386 [Brassica carinata]